MSKTQTICQCCGGKVTRHKHCINKTLISALWKLKQHNKSAWLDELNLTNSEHANFQKLRYFKLTVKTDDSHRWVMTDFGAGFLEGTVKCNYAVFTEKGRVVDYSLETILVGDVKKCAQYKVEWQDQRSGQGRLV